MSDQLFGSPTFADNAGFQVAFTRFENVLLRFILVAVGGLGESSCVLVGWPEGWRAGTGVAGGEGGSGAGSSEMWIIGWSCLAVRLCWWRPWGWHVRMLSGEIVQ